MKKKLLAVSIALIGITTFSGCTKPKDGAPGPAGATGNANVQNTSITVHSSQWTYDNLYQRNYYRYYCTANSQSAVLGYVMSGSGQQAMPYYQPNPAPAIQFDIAGYLFGTPPYVEFQCTNFPASTTPPSSDTYFYLVIIPPAIMKQHPDLNLRDYQAVKKALNLKDR